MTPTIIILGIILVAIVAICLSGYVKAPADEAYIISGLRKEPKVLIGRAGIKIPFFERKDKLVLKQISIDIKTDGYVPTHDFIGVNIDSIAKIRLITYNDVNTTKTYTKTIIDENGNPQQTTVEITITEEMAKAAMRNFLNMTEEKIIASLTDSLQGNMREIIGSQDLRQLCQDRKAFGDEVQSKAQPDMNALGVWIESCNIQKLDDEQNLINALGMDNMAAIQKNASIAKANADKEVAIAQSQAAIESNNAKVKADTEIAQKQNELAIKQAELKQESDTKKAIADAAYEIQKEEQRKTIEITTANANIARQEREIELKRKEAEVKEQALDAEVRKQADAEKYRRQQEAEAELIEKSRKADAEKYQQEKEAEIRKIKAEADKEAKKKEAEGILAVKQAEAEGIAAVGKAEAEAIAAKGLAEAEAMEKKAEAMKKYGQAAMTQMIIEQLPEIAKAIAEPISSIDKVTIIDSGNGESGVSSVGGYTPAVLAKVIESIKETTGFDLKEVMKAQTYDAMVDKKIDVTGIPNEIKIEQ